MIPGDTFAIDGNELIPLYDPPHLLKCMRNNLLTKLLEVDANKGQRGDAERQFLSWDVIEMAYKIDTHMNTLHRQVPKLHDRHVIKNKIKKMKVKYASQVFSRQLSGFIEFLSNIDGNNCHILK